MSAATFRRSGKIEQARGAIQEAEVRDEENPNVWVQVSKSAFFFPSEPGARDRIFINLFDK